jgi:tetratricopeptide (TPR) repeat protein
LIQSQPPITRTTHTLPFDKLSPRDFERLCLWLVEREGYQRAEHLGAAGSEQGRDIIAWRESALWAFQCKRVQRFGPKDALAEVEKVLALPEAERPAGLVFLVTCNVPVRTRRKVRARCAREMECHFWTGTELDEKVKRHPDIVEEFFEAERGKDATLSWWDRFRHHPLIFYPTVAFTILVAVVGLLAGLISMGADIGGARQQLQEWGLVRVFPPAREDEILILVATFHLGERVADTEAYNEICWAIQEATQELNFSHLRVEVEPTRLAADDRAGAEKLGKRYNASMVIWGADTGVRVTVNFLNLKQPDFTAAEVQISETERTQLANPSAYASFVTRDLPGQLTFLSLFAIGQSYYIAGAYADSIRVVEKAVGSLVPETEPPEGLADAYFGLGWLYQRQMDNHEQAILNYNCAIALDPSAVVAYNNRGLAYYYKSDYDRAIADFDQAIQLQPGFALAYNGRGLAYADKGDYDRAIADFDQAIQLQPYFAEAYGNRGIAYAAKGDYDRAITEYSQVIRLRLDDARAYKSRGDAYRRKGDLERAIADYDQAIQFKPDYGGAYYNRGLAYADKGDLDRAIADYDQAIANYSQAIQLQPDNAMAYFNRGLAYYSKGDYGQAIADLNQAIQLKPHYADAYYTRGLAYGQKGKYDRAIADFNQTIKLQPNYADAYNNRGLAYADEGEYDRALTDYDWAIELQPALASAYYNRGAIYASRGDYDRAITDYDQAIQLQPDYAGAYTNRGLAYAHKGDVDRAIADYDQAIQLQPDNAYAYNNRGLAYADKGEYDRAIADYDQAIQWHTTPERRAEAHNNRGLAYADKSEYDRAIADYDQAIQLQPNYAKAYYNRGIAYEQTGHEEKAVADFRKVLELGDDPYWRQQAEEQLKALRAR